MRREFASAVARAGSMAAKYEYAMELAADSALQALQGKSPARIRSAVLQGGFCFCHGFIWNVRSRPKKTRPQQMTKPERNPRRRKWAVAAHCPSAVVQTFLSERGFIIPSGNPSCQAVFRGNAVYEWIKDYKNDKNNLQLYCESCMISVEG